GLLTGREYDSIVMGMQQFMWAWGGSWGDAKTMKASGFANSPGSIAGVQFAKDLLKFSPPEGERFSYDKCLECMKNESVAMGMDYFAFYPDLSKTMGEKVGFTLVPSKDGKRVISLGGQGMSISTKVSKDRQEEAKKFIAWFLKKENQEKWVTKPAGFTA